MRSIKNITEVVGNYSHTENKYSNKYFNILENERHSRKKKTTWYTLVLYGTIILEIRIKISTIRGKVKYRTLKILLDFGIRATIIPGNIIPKVRCKNSTTTKWETYGGALKIQYKATVLFQLP